MSVTVQGILQRDPEVRRWAVGDAVAVLTIAATAGAGTLFETRVPVSDDRIRPSQRGRAVLVMAAALEYRVDHNGPMFVLRDPIRVVIDGEELL